LATGVARFEHRTDSQVLEEPVPIISAALKVREINALQLAA